MKCASVVGIGDELEREEVAGATDVADDRDVAQALDALTQPVLLRPDALEDALLLDELEVAQPDRAAHRVTAEREAVREARARLEEGLGDAVAAITAPRGEYPLVRPLAMVIMSGR